MVPALFEEVVENSQKKKVKYMSQRRKTGYCKVFDIKGRRAKRESMLLELAGVDGGAARPTAPPGGGTWSNWNVEI